MGRVVQGNGFIRTELFRHVKSPQRYITIDEWQSVKDYEDFRFQWKEKYEVLDKQCEGLTEQESLLGTWETVK